MFLAVTKLSVCLNQQQLAHKGNGTKDLLKIFLGFFFLIQPHTMSSFLSCFPDCPFTFELFFSPVFSLKKLPYTNRLKSLSSQGVNMTLLFLELVYLSFFHFSSIACKFIVINVAGPVSRCISNNI